MLLPIPIEVVHAIVALVLIGFSAISYWKKLLSPGGILLADVIGVAAYYLGGLPTFTTLIVFYIIAEAATGLAKTSKGKHERRSISNILGNGGAAMIALFLGYQIAFFGAIAAALADTVSSEIGMLSRKKPVLITSFEKVERGTDGGITLLGTGASIIAGLFIAGVYYFMVQESALMAAIIIVAGIVGSFVDSILGAVFERRGKLSNSQVNFLASVSGAITAAALYAAVI